MITTLTLLAVAMYPLSTLSLSFRIAMLLYFTIKYLKNQIVKKQEKKVYKDSENFCDFIVV